MPRGDGTGPMGMGPMTGRAAGYCAGYNVPGFMNPVGGRGAGFGGGGFGRGRRNWYHATGMPGWQRAGMGMPAWGMPGYGYASPAGYAPTGEQELGALKTQAEYLEKSLDEIRKRMNELEKSKAK
ncbi:MAG: DUF5320 domain-containing protein [Candidatus Coatesbacteria bacterium]|nr:DUF5320 domain-containing protein [Candidatus Coatesbacteria bacterium]